MYYVNPSTYWIGGILAATLPAVQVVCSASETTLFRAPPGTTCAEYAGTYISDVLRRGYLVDPAATDVCGYCAFRDGTEYLTTLNLRPDQQWRDFGIFLLFVLSNWALVYFFIYTVRVRGWSFGLGFVARVLRRAAAGVAGLVRGIKGKREGVSKEENVA